MSTGILKLDITEGELQNAIAVALVDAFSPDKRDALIRDLVRAHLATKIDPYSRETIISRTVGDHVRRVARDILAARLEEMNGEIEAIVRSILGPRFEKQVLDQLKESLGRIYANSLTIEATLVRED